MKPRKKLAYFLLVVVIVISLLSTGAYWVSQTLPIGSDGDIIFHDGSKWTTLSAGTSGQYLKTMGSSTDPVWDSVSASGTNDHGDPTTLTDEEYSDASPYVTMTAGANLSASQVVYIGTDGKMELADGSSNSTIPVVMMSTEAIVEDATGVFIMPGSFYCESDWSFTAGDRLWLSTATPGAITDVQPSGSGNYTMFMGIAIDTDIIMFIPDGTWVEIP
jgi:hypothetical protein